MSIKIPFFGKKEEQKEFYEYQGLEKNEESQKVEEVNKENQVQEEKEKTQIQENQTKEDNQNQEKLPDIQKPKEKNQDEDISKINSQIQEILSKIKEEKELIN